MIIKMFDILKKEDFWTGWHCAVIILGIALLVNSHFFPNEFEEKGRKKLCELKQYEYCTNEELEELLKKIIK